MPVAPPLGAGIYGLLPFQYPLIDVQPVVRIPVVGPDSFNTLVVVRQSFGLHDIELSDGILRRFTWDIPTNFSAIGFDPRLPSPSAHSSTMVLHMLQSKDETPIVAAVDSVDEGFFDASGRWTLRIRTAALSEGSDTWACYRGYISSWVLCFELPPDPRLSGLKTRAFVPHTSPSATLSAIDAADSTPTLANLKDHLRKSARERRKRDDCGRCGG